MQALYSKKVLLLSILIAGCFFMPQQAHADYIYGDSNSEFFGVSGSAQQTGWSHSAPANMYIHSSTIEVQVTEIGSGTVTGFIYPRMAANDSTSGKLFPEELIFLAPHVSGLIL